MSRPFALTAPKRPSLPTNRAFVAHLHAGARVEKDEFTDRVEHLMSVGRPTSPLHWRRCAFITRALSAQSARDGGQGSA